MSNDIDYTAAAAKFEAAGKKAKPLVDGKIYESAIGGIVAQLDREVGTNSKTAENVAALALVKIAEQLGEILAFMKEAK